MVLLSSKTAANGKAIPVRQRYVFKWNPKEEQVLNMARAARPAEAVIVSLLPGKKDRAPACWRLPKKMVLDRQLAVSGHLGPSSLQCPYNKRSSVT